MEVSFPSSDRETCRLYATAWQLQPASRPVRILVNSWKIQPDDNHNSKTDHKHRPNSKKEIREKMRCLISDKLISALQTRLKEYSTHNSVLCKQSSLDTASSTEQSALNSTTMEKEKKAKTD